MCIANFCIPDIFVGHVKCSCGTVAMAAPTVEKLHSLMKFPQRLVVSKFNKASKFPFKPLPLINSLVDQ